LVRHAHPLADELDELERQPEEILEHGDEPLGRAHGEAEPGGPRELRGVGHGIAIAKLGRRDADQAADVDLEPLRGRTVQAHGGLRVRPRPVEQAHHPVMEHVRKAAERRIADELARVRVLRQMNRQRPVRAEQPERVRGEIARPARLAGSEGRDRRRRERERRLLPEPHVLGRRTRGLADARHVGMEALELAKRREEIELVRRFLEGPQPLYNVWRRPRRGGHRITSPRSTERNAVCVNELIETYFAKNSSITLPNRNSPPPPKAASSHVSVTPSPRPKGTGPSAGILPSAGDAVIDVTPSIWRSVAASFGSQ